MTVSTEIRQRAIALLERLPESMLDEAVQLLESLRVKADSVREVEVSTLPDDSVRAVDLAKISWAETVYSLAGTWQEDFPTLEDIRAESEQDIVRERL